MRATMEAKEARGWLLYDEECGVCHRVVPFFRETLRKRGFAIAPLQSDWVRECLKISPDETLDLLRDHLRLLLPDGRQVVGADAYRYVMKRVWWSYPIYLLSVVPLLRNVIDWGYRTFARNRYWVAKACGLPGASEAKRAGGVVRDSESRIESSQSSGSAGGFGRRVRRVSQRRKR